LFVSAIQSVPGASRDPARLAQHRGIARRMFCGSRAEMNVAECTPITATGWSLKRSSMRWSPGCTYRQLMQQ
jgi:hypothetical protein